MLGSERRRMILLHAAQYQSIETQRLADELGVSLMTIRRDIKRLEQEGFIRQTYGGATVQLTKSVELGFNSRSLQDAAQKRLIGARAAQMVEGVEHLFLGVGTTTAQFAQFLPARPHLQVVTSSLSHASLLSSRKISVIVLGGALDPDDLGVVGPIAHAAAARFYLDLCVLGAAGLDPDIGVTEAHYEVAALHRLLIEQAKQVLLLADHSKLLRRAPAIVAPAGRVHTLVTDGGAPAAAVTLLQAHGMRIVIADSSLPSSEMSVRKPGGRSRYSPAR